jgi:hypothetical protein
MNELMVTSPRMKALENKNKKMVSLEMDKSEIEIKEPVTYSIMIFSSEGSFRKFLINLISNPYFDGFIYRCIAFNSLMLTLDVPALTDTYQIKTIDFILTIVSIIFVLELVIKVIAMGFV